MYGPAGTFIYIGSVGVPESIGLSIFKNPSDLTSLLITVVSTHLLTGPPVSDFTINLWPASTLAAFSPSNKT